MSATATYKTKIIVPSAGGELAGCESSQEETLTNGTPWSNTKLLADDDAGGDVVLYDATASGNPATWQKLAIYIDPDAEKSSVLDINIEIRVTTTLLVFTVNRSFPLVFCKQAADLAIPAAGIGASTINRVRAANNNAAPVSGNSDVKVRVLILS